MKIDISNRKDVELFVNQFYEKLLNDENISHFFDHLIVNDHLEEHLKTISDFWEDILFLTTHYGRNAMKPHLELHHVHPFIATNFKIWLRHFNATIDANFTGEKANLAKTRALSIATIMQIKLQDS